MAALAASAKTAILGDGDSSGGVFNSLTPKGRCLWVAVGDSPTWQCRPLTLVERFVFKTLDFDKEAAKSCYVPHYY